MSTLNMVALVLLVIGGLNWGLAVFDYNLVNSLFGSWPAVEDMVYGLVGLSALWVAYDQFMGKKA